MRFYALKPEVVEGRWTRGTYNTKKQTTFTLNTETTNDWYNEQWTVLLNLMVGQLVKVGKMPIQFQVGDAITRRSPRTAPSGGCVLPQRSCFRSSRDKE